MENQEKYMTWINDRNKIYNQKLDRHFGEYVKEV